jgi:hypothetical protein
MARYVMVLRRARSITRGIGRVGPEMATSEASARIWALKSRPHPYSSSLQNNLEINSAV